MTKYRCKNGHETTALGFFCELRGWGTKWCVNCLDEQFKMEQVKEEKPPLKLEVGKFYRAKDGRKAFVFNIYKDEEHDVDVAQVVKIGEYHDRDVAVNGGCTYWRYDGGYNFDDDSLIEEWKD